MHPVQVGRTDIGIDIGIGPYSPFQTFSDGQGLQMYDFIKREVYEANFTDWTVNRGGPTLSGIGMPNM